VGSHREAGKKNNEGGKEMEGKCFDIACDFCGHAASEHVVDDEELRECTICSCEQYDCTKYKNRLDDEKKRNTV
jgi:hypothetical protein